MSLLIFRVERDLLLSSLTLAWNISRKVGTLFAAHVIPAPHEDIDGQVLARLDDQ